MEIIIINFYLSESHETADKIQSWKQPGLITMHSVIEHKLISNTILDKIVEKIVKCMFHSKFQMAKATNFLPPKTMFTCNLIVCQRPTLPRVGWGEGKSHHILCCYEHYNISREISEI